MTHRRSSETSNVVLELNSCFRHDTCKCTSHAYLWLNLHH